MKFRRSKVLFVCVAGLFAGRLSAAPDTTSLPPAPITIEADQVKFDERAGSSTYSGHVLLLQDRVRIQADLLSVVSHDGRLEKLLASGGPVSFQQQASATNAALEGEALRIEYYATDKKIFLLDKARLRQGGSEFAGDRIEYDIDKQTISANAVNPAQERVRVTIVPQSTPKSETTKDMSPNPSAPRNDKKP